MGHENVGRGFVQRRLGRGVYRLPDRFDELSVARFDGLAPVRGQREAERDQRIARADAVELFGVAQVVAFAVRPHAPGVQHQESGTARGPNLGDDCVHLLEELRIVVAVAPRGEAERRAARLEVAADGMPAVGGLRDPVVLDDDEQGRAPHRREIHRLVHETLAERAVADHGDDEAAAVAKLVRQREAGADTHHAALHTVAVEVPVSEVLAAAPATADPCFAAHDLGHQADEVARVGEEVAVVAVVGEDDVLGIVERPHDRHRGQLLAEAGVRRARHEAARELVEDQLLGEPDQVTESEEAFPIESDPGLAVRVAGDAGQRPWRGRGGQIGRGGNC